MRPEAPELHLAPEPERTQPATPLAKGNLEMVVEAVVERTLERLAVTWVPLIAARVVDAITMRLARVEAAQGAYESRTIALEKAVAELQADVAELRAASRHSPTMPAPPPEGG